MARYAVTATSADGNSGEGPLYYTAETPEAARQQYIDWASAQYGQLYSGPSRPAADTTPSPGAVDIEFPNISVELVTA